MRFLVTGCSGLVGHGICKHLLEAGHEVVGTSRNALTSADKHFSSVQLNLSNAASIEALRPWVKKSEVIVHCAAHVPPSGEANWSACYEANVLGTRKLFELIAQEKSTARVIFISGTAVVGNPAVVSEQAPYALASDYLTTKAMGELLCIQLESMHRIPVTILRVRAPYGYLGRAEGVIPRFIDLALQSRPLTLWGKGQRKQTFIFSEDIGLACELAAQRNASGTFNICGSRANSMHEVAELILKLLPQSRSKIEVTNQQDPHSSTDPTILTDKAAQQLGFNSPTLLEEGLRKVIDWKSSKLRESFFKI